MFHNFSANREDVNEVSFVDAQFPWNPRPRLLGLVVFAAVPVQANEIPTLVGIRAELDRLL